MCTDTSKPDSPVLVYINISVYKKIISCAAILRTTLAPTKPVQLFKVSQAHHFALKGQLILVLLKLFVLRFWLIKCGEIAVLFFYYSTNIKVTTLCFNSNYVEGKNWWISAFDAQVSLIIFYAQDSKIKWKTALEFSNYVSYIHTHISKCLIIRSENYLTVGYRLCMPHDLSWERYTVTFVVRQWSIQSPYQAHLEIMKLLLFCHMHTCKQATLLDRRPSWMLPATAGK